LVEKLADPFPWIAVLPAAARRSFVLEFLATARACAAVGRFERLTIALAAWKGTAEVYAAGESAPALRQAVNRRSR